MVAQKVDVFEKSTFLVGLTPEQRSELAASLRLVEVKAGDVVFYAGEKGDKAYFVLEGEVELSTFDHAGEKIVYAIAKPTHMFGELALLDGKPRSATALAMKSCKLYAIDHDTLMAFLKRHPEAAVNVLTSLASRLRQADEKLRFKTAKNANEEYERRTSFFEDISVRLGEFTGTTTFFLVNLIIVLAWCTVNIFYIPFFPQFDPAESNFAWLQFYLGGLGSFFITLLVMISQNAQSEKDRIKNDIQYQVNLKTELSITQLRERLEELHQTLNVRLDGDRKSKD